MVSIEHAEEFCKECLNKIPEKDRIAIFQNLGKLYRATGKGYENCCQNPFSCINNKDK